MGITFEREYGYWSQLAVIYREKLEECLEGLEHLMSPLLYQLSYTASTRKINDLRWESQAGSGHCARNCVCQPFCTMHLGAWKTRAAALTNRPFGSLVFDPTHLVRFVEHTHPVFLSCWGVTCGH